MDGLLELTLLSVRHQVILAWRCPWLVDHLSEPLPPMSHTRPRPMPGTQWWFTVVSPCLVPCQKREAGSALHCGSCWPPAAQCGAEGVTEGQHGGVGSPGGPAVVLSACGLGVAVRQPIRVCEWREFREGAHVAAPLGVVTMTGSGDTGEGNASAASLCVGAPQALARVHQCDPQ